MFFKLFHMSIQRSVCLCHRIYYSKLCNNSVKSVLFIPSKKATELTSVIEPCIDIADRLQDLDLLQNNLKLRKSNLNIDHIKELWNLLEKHTKYKLKLEEKRVETAENMKAAVNNGDKVNAEKYKHQGKMLRGDLKTVLNIISDIEEDLIPDILKIPNIIGDETPPRDDSVLYEFGSRPTDRSPSHIEIGTSANILTYMNSWMYFLLDKAALFEFKASMLLEKVLKSKNFIQFSNSDFVRSIIVEGCGSSPWCGESVLSLKDIDIESSQSKINRLHLSGGASLQSFSAFFTKQLVLSPLPICCFTVARQYYPVPSNPLPGLFGSGQTTAAEVFILTACKADMMTMFKEMINVMIDIFKSIGYHFRIVYVSADKLEPWESVRASVQMYACSLQSYIEVAHVSTSDTYISKRLLIYNHDQSDFLCLISGTVLNITKTLACIIEYKRDCVYNISDIFDEK